MTVDDLIQILKVHPPDARVRFSIAIDEKEDDEERWFCEDGIADCFAIDNSEVTICLVGESNYLS